MMFGVFRFRDGDPARLHGYAKGLPTWRSFVSEWLPTATAETVQGGEPLGGMANWVRRVCHAYAVRCSPERGAWFLYARGGSLGMGRATGCC